MLLWDKVAGTPHFHCFFCFIAQTTGLRDFSFAEDPRLAPLVSQAQTIGVEGYFRLRVATAWSQRQLGEKSTCNSPLGGAAEGSPRGPGLGPEASPGAAPGLRGQSSRQAAWPLLMLGQQRG